MIKSIVICRHGKLGYSAALAIDDVIRNISHTDKNKMYRMIDFLINKAQQRKDKNENKYPKKGVENHSRRQDDKKVISIHTAR